MIDALLTAFGLRTGTLHQPPPARRCASASRSTASRSTQDACSPRGTTSRRSSRWSRRTADGPLTFFEVLTALAFAAFADAPGRRRGRRGRTGRRGTPPTSSTRRRRRDAGQHRPHRLARSRPRRDRGREGRRSSSQGWSPCSPSRRPRRPRCCSSARRDVGATVARENVDFGVLERQVAVGGQLLTLRDSAAPTTRSSCRCTARIRHTTPPVPSPLSRPSSGAAAGALDPDVVREGFAAVSVPGRLEVVRRSPTVLVDVAHNPDGARGAGRGGARTPSTSVGWSGWSACSPTRTPAASWRPSSRC